ncbi:MAG: M3 family oligoendopeptidase [Chloroflexota bacterium]
MTTLKRAAGSAAEKLLPRWDMTPIFPSLESPEFDAGFSHVADEIDQLQELFDRYDIGLQEPKPLDDAAIAVFEEAITAFNTTLEEYRTLSAYIQCILSTDTRDSVALNRFSEMQGQSLRISQLGTRWTAWIGSLDVEELIKRSPLAADHAYNLGKARRRATHLMSPAEENLAAELNLSGGSAWEKLHMSVASQLSVPVTMPDGEARTLPMSVVRNLASDPDREVRRVAYEAELEGWKSVAVPLAAALNSVKGEVNTLSRRRGWESALDEAIFDSNIDRETLDAMMEAARESFPDFRRYMHAKARLMGIDKLAWYDVIAPVGEGNRVWDYPDAMKFIIEQFSSYSNKLGDFADRAFREQWVDAEPRSGKRDGAYCMPIRRDESRVFTNYKPRYGGVSTLAHELGHAYHNFVKSHRTTLQKSTPMTLAETASIFCETIIRHAAMKDANPEEQLSILAESIQDSLQVVVDISSRFIFESRLFEKRRERELTIDELCNLMLDSQRETYGDGLDETKLHPYMWAVKQHYYRVGLSFYNFPYMFGLLFGLGLYAQYQRDPEAFQVSYDVLLSSTGMDDAATLAKGFGIDIHTSDFWRSSLDLIRADIDQFEKLVK